MALRWPLTLRKKPALGVVVGLWIAVGCVTVGSEDKGATGPPTYSPDSSGVVIQDGQVADGPGDSRTSVTSINPLCGTVNFDCGVDPVTDTENTPDDVTACEGFDGGSSGGSGGSSSVFGGAGGALDGSTGLDSDASTGNGSGGVTWMMDAGAKAADGSSLFVASPTYPTAVGTLDAGPAYACQVVAADNAVPVRRCVKAGTGGVGAPCSASGDCQAGLACVGTQGAGQCRPYCCESSTQCGIDSSDQADGHGIVTYCGERPLLDGTSKTGSLMVPVCVPADGCRLEEPYPCTTSNCTCPTGTACTIVGSGTTSCVTPGTGKLGDPCQSQTECAWGYFCSQSTQTCVKICKTSAMDSACSPGVCQATAGFPDGFGLCVGLSPTLK